MALRFDWSAMFDYNTTKWERKRLSILRRDGYQCQECKRYGRMRSGNHVHHIYPSERYPQYAMENWNLITLCRECHNAMHDRDTHELSTKGEQLRDRINRTRLSNGIPGQGGMV